MTIQEGLIVFGIGVASVIAAAVTIKWGMANNIPILKNAAI